MSGLFRRLLPAARPVRRPVSSRRPTSPKARLLLRALEDRLVPATFTVANVNDAGAGSLRQAILDTNANPGADAIAFDPAAFGSAQTISLLTALPTISDDVSITGPTFTTAQPLVTVQRSPAAADLFRVFDIDGPGTLTVSLSNLTVSGGQTARGGGVRNADESVSVTNSVVSDNTATEAGGGIYSAAGSVTLVNSTLSNNHGIQAGGIRAESGAVTLTNSTVIGNRAGLQGGGVTIGNGSLVVSGSTITGNTAGDLGGGLLAFLATSVVVTDSTVAENSAGGGGGIASFESASIRLVNTTISGNTASAGGSGGGLNFLGDGPIEVLNSTIAGNRSGLRGGGVSWYPSSGNTLAIRNTTISGNSAPTGGGIGLGYFAGTLLVQNSTIVNNTATTNQTVAGTGGGGIALASGVGNRGLVGEILVQSSVVAGNSAANGRPDMAAPNLPNVTVTADHSLIGVADTVTLSPASAGNRVGTVVAPLNPVLGPLADNGGPTLTHAPLAGSPAINAGGNPAGLATDQRGGPRVNSLAADVGAVEVVAGGVPAAAAGPTPTVTTAGGTSYQFTVTYSDDTAIAVATLNAGDLVVTGPAGFSALATLVSVDVDSDGTPRTATYRFSPPGGSWDPAESGTYLISLQPNQVTDVGGTAVPAGGVAIVRVVIPQVFTVTTLADTGPGSLRDAIGRSNAAPAADVIQFAPALFAAGPGVVSLSTALPTISDAVTVSGPGSGRLTVRRDPNAFASFAVISADGAGFMTVNLTGLTVTGGDAGGLTLSNETVTLTDVVVVNNKAGSRGGGVTSSGILTIRDSTISDNTAGMFTSGSGGGIHVSTQGSLVLERSTVSGNTAIGPGVGGGILAESRATVTILNSTISGNRAASGGGVGLTTFIGSVLIQNSTIASNTATATGTAAGQGGGGVSLTAATPAPTLTLQSTLLAGNVATNGRPDITVSVSTVVTADHSLIGAADTITLSPSSANNLTGTVAAPLDPKLGPLAANGGPTWTHALLAGSPALNAGSNPANVTTDQRGSARVVGPAADIGAYEYKPVGVLSVQVNDGGGQRSMVRSLTVTFSGQVSFANADPAAAFALARVTGAGGTVGLTAAVSSNALGQTVVALTFAGGTATDPLSLQNGAYSLADGRYRLAVVDGAVADAATGWGLDGDGNGTPGGAYQSPDDTAAGGPGQVRLYRLFGDATGNGTVDAVDLAAFRGAFNAGVGSPAYRDYLDANNDGTVDAVDLGQFRGRVNASVFV